MAHTYHLEIKTFTISKGIQRSALSADEIGASVFNLNKNTFNQTAFISSFKQFVQEGFASLAASDGFIVNDTETRKFRIVELVDNHEYNSFFGIYIGGTIGEKGKFNKKKDGKYQSEIMGPEDFTDIPFLFYIHFPVGSSVGVLMLYGLPPFRPFTKKILSARVIQASLRCALAYTIPSLFVGTPHLRLSISFLCNVLMRRQSHLLHPP